MIYFCDAPDEEDEKNQAEIPQEDTIFGIPMPLIIELERRKINGQG